MSDPFEDSPRPSKRQRTSRVSSRSEKRLGQERREKEGDATTRIEAEAQAEDDTRGNEAEPDTPTKTEIVRSARTRSSRSVKDHHNTGLHDLAVTAPVDGSTNRGSQRRKTNGAKPTEPGTDQGQVSLQSAVIEDESAITDEEDGMGDEVPDSQSEDEPYQDTRVDSSTGLVNKLGQVASTILSPLKGILTPSRRHRNKSSVRKSVAFGELGDEDETTIGERLGFKDIRNGPADILYKAGSGQLPDDDEDEDFGNLDEEHEEDTDENDGRYLDLPLDAYADYALSNSTSLHSLHPPHSPSRSQQPHPFNSHSQLTRLKSQVLARLTSRSQHSNFPSTHPLHLASQYKTIHTLLTSTILHSESNSLLVLGPRASGKTLLVEHSLSNLRSTYGTDFFHTVILSGQIQTDDRLALLEIWRQLGREMALDDQDDGAGAGIMNVADAMASLLALLSHEDDFEPLEDGRVIDADTDGLAEKKTTKSVVFILNDFELFTTHPRQQLLYTLFDIAQSRKAPIAVVGCSTRMDVVDCLEKRVKSRFSHRWVFVPHCRTLGEFDTEVRRNLRVESVNEDKNGIAILKKRKAKSDDIEKDVASRWNLWIENRFLTDDGVQRVIRSQFYANRSLPDAFITLYALLAQVTWNELCGTDAAGTPEEKEGKGDLSGYKSVLANPNGTSTTLPASLTNVPSTLVVLPTLPTLHLALLVAATRLSTIHYLHIVNLNLVYAHYSELITRSKLQQAAAGNVAAASGGGIRSWSKEICRTAWQELGIWGLLLPATGTDNGVNGTSAGESEETRMWRCEVGLDEVEWSLKIKSAENGGVGGAEDVLGRWCREI